MGKFICTLGDAFEAVLAFHDLYRHGHAAVICDDDGAILDLTAFTRPGHTVDDALNWAHCFVFNESRATRIVLVSVVPGDVFQLREEDLETFGRMREVFGSYGVEVLDWVRSDGEHLRSYAVTTGMGPWGRTDLPVLEVDGYDDER